MIGNSNQTNPSQPGQTPGSSQKPQKIKPSVQNLNLSIQEERLLSNVSTKLKESSKMLSVVLEAATHTSAIVPIDKPELTSLIKASQDVLAEANQQFRNNYCEQRAEAKARIVEATRQSPTNPRETFKKEHEHFNKQDKENREAFMAELNNTTDLEKYEARLSQFLTPAQIKQIQTQLSTETDTAQKAYDTAKTSAINPATQKLDSNNPDLIKASKTLQEAKKRQEEFSLAVTTLQLEDANAKSRLTQQAQSAMAAIDQHNEEVLATQEENFKRAYHASWLDKSNPKSTELSAAESAFGAKEDKVDSKLSKLSRKIGPFTKVHTDGKGLYFDTTGSFIGKWLSKLCPASDKTALEKAKLIVRTAQENNWDVINLRGLDEKTAAFVVLEQKRCEREHGYKSKNIFYYEPGEERGRCIRDADAQGPDDELDEKNSGIEKSFLTRRTTASVPLLRTSSLGIGLPDVKLPFLTSALTHEQKYNRLIAKQQPELTKGAMARILEATSMTWYDKDGCENAVNDLLHSERHTPEEKSKLASDVLKIKKVDPDKFKGLDENTLKSHVIVPAATTTKQKPGSSTVP